MQEYRFRARIFIGLILLILGILGGRLAWLQLIDAERYFDESRTAIRKERVLPSRGVIYDRNGLLMVDNEPSFTLQFTPYHMDKDNHALLAELLGVDVATVEARYAQAKDWNPFRPSPAFREVPFKTISKIAENTYRLPGITYEVAHKRRYHTDARAAHMLGYVREINRQELNVREDANYIPGDLIGTAGLEKRYEPQLRGQLGSAYKLIGLRGQEIESYRNQSQDLLPVGGYDLHLTIDSKVQALAESLFVNKRGAAVAIDPRDGAVLALVSQPDYDPELFSESVSPDMWRYLTESEDKPMFNRATQSGFMPGSTWKPFMALMALEEGIIKPNSTLYCPGGYQLGGRLFKCHGGVHGAIDVQTAIQKSCNTFFFTLMMKTDVNTFKDWATTFGFGQRMDIDIDQQSAGLIPDSAYYNRHFPRGWTPGYSINLGIGQGDMLVTPLQLTRYIAAVANGGTLHTPHLVKEIRAQETGASIIPELPPPSRIPIQPAHFETVRQGMRRVMELGTGRWAQLPGITSGGKTGTAQNPHGEDHSLFVMFAPYDDPQIALAVMVENGGFGATQAAPIASLMAEQYLTGAISPKRLYLIPHVMQLKSEAL